MMIIKVLGTWCPTCNLLQKTVEDAAQTLGLTYQIIKVQDMQDIVQYEVMALPALVIDEKIICTGSIPDAQHMRDILTHQKLSNDFAKWCGCQKEKCCGWHDQCSCS